MKTTIDTTYSFINEGDLTVNVLSNKYHRVTKVIDAYSFESEYVGWFLNTWYRLQRWVKDKFKKKYKWETVGDSSPNPKCFNRQYGQSYGSTIYNNKD